MDTCALLSSFVQTNFLREGVGVHAPCDAHSLSAPAGSYVETHAHVAPPSTSVFGLMWFKENATLLWRPQTFPWEVRRGPVAVALASPPGGVPWAPPRPTTANLSARCMPCCAMIAFALHLSRGSNCRARASRGKDSLAVNSTKRCFQ